MIIYLIAGIALIISYLIDKKKTINALKLTYHKLKKILPSFIIMLIFVSIAFYFVSADTITKYLGNGSQIYGMFLAFFFGSISIMPGFIAFPLAGVLLENGASYIVIAAFTTTLMMVGVVTFPVEKEYLGTKVSLIRNTIGLLIALTVSIIIGVFY
ncbi:MAG: hypothetical protein FXF47_09885 [Candidatus Mcinerneyibacterium aminivorans]|uniref:Permease n=1 Tax=Candidatus Mcinerneyibacterium aminivorans TaxID=2703815 RepID=A0A5D0M9D8_9BACT|nr:MAG: hypothetical protein FXF47_09885 [Candidatus Mcinerneyibacterium aminivorans]